jgi:hypothetical protein
MRNEEKQQKSNEDGDDDEQSGKDDHDDSRLQRQQDDDGDDKAKEDAPKLVAARGLCGNCRSPNWLYRRLKPRVYHVHHPEVRLKALGIHCGSCCLNRSGYGVLFPTS